jgi:hypothetical protein
MMRGIAPTAGRVPVATSDTVELSTATRTRALIGGSKSDRFNNTLIAAAVSTGWFPPGQSDTAAARSSSQSPAFRGHDIERVLNSPPN